jgi:hypothetical protein
MARKKKRITIGTGWDGGDTYHIDYVNRLYSMVCRHTTIPFDFVVYTGPLADRPGRLDGLEKGIRTVPVGLPYWWCTAPFLRPDPPGIDTDSILYLDVDQVIVGSLDALIEYPSDHCYMKDYPAHSCPPGCERHACGSTSLIRNGAAAKLWDIYVADGMPTWPPGKPDPKSRWRLGAETVRNDPGNGIVYDLFPEEWVCSYKLQVARFGFPDDCRIVAFHGQPKMVDCTHEEFVREHWI